jgi:hypothetical protein
MASSEVSPAGTLSSPGPSAVANTFTIVATKPSWTLRDDLREMLRAALEYDPTLQAIDYGDGTARLFNRDSDTDISISIPGTIYGNGRLGGLINLLFDFSPLKSHHSRAYAAIRNTVRRVVEPEYWDEILD